MKDRVFDPVSFVKARRAQQTANLANGDITFVLNMIEGLQQQVADLTDALALSDETAVALASRLVTAEEIVAALTNTYGLHAHAYTDVDNLAVTTNKITGTPV